jgi:hypothetical protein
MALLLPRIGFWVFAVGVCFGVRVLSLPVSMPDPKGEKRSPLVDLK